MRYFVADMPDLDYLYVGTERQMHHALRRLALWYARDSNLPFARAVAFSVLWRIIEPLTDYCQTVEDAEYLLASSELRDMTVATRKAITRLRDKLRT